MTDWITKSLQINLPVQGEPHLERLMGRVTDPADLNELVRDSLTVFVVHAEQAVQRLTLTEPEVGALLSMVMGISITPGLNFVLVLEHALECGLDEEWNIDGTSLLWRIQALHPFEVAALAMTLKAAWNIVERYEGDLMAAARSLGLLPAEMPVTP